MQYLRVKNLEQYQHYSTRNPPWIKLYRSLLGDYELRQLTAETRYLYIGCLILASECDNRLVSDVKFLSERLGFTVTEEMITSLINSGFLLASSARRALASARKCSSLLSSVEETPLHSLSSLPLSSSKTPYLKSKHHTSKSGATWEAYRQSFQARYGVDPVRNAKTNSQLGQLVDRLGQEEAPAVAAFYCTHDGLLYVRGKHCVDLLLRDAEGLRMEWATGRQVTSGQAALTDRTSTTGAIVKKLIAEEEAKHVDRHT